MKPSQPVNATIDGKLKSCSRLALFYLGVLVVNALSILLIALASDQPDPKLFMALCILLGMAIGSCLGTIAAIHIVRSKAPTVRLIFFRFRVHRLVVYVFPFWWRRRESNPAVGWQFGPFNFLILPKTTKA